MISMLNWTDMEASDRDLLWVILHTILSGRAWLSRLWTHISYVILSEIEFDSILWHDDIFQQLVK
jgi:hypothetical protein